jgi:hypothetical protein
VKTVSSFVLVPAGMELDWEAVLAAADEPLGSGMGELMGQAAGRGAEAAARDAMSRISGGILGRRGQQEEPGGQPTPGTQSIVMRITSSVEGVQTGPVADDLRRPPSGYEERVPEWMRGGAGGPGS